MIYACLLCAACVVAVSTWTLIYISALVCEGRPPRRIPDGNYSSARLDALRASASATPPRPVPGTGNPFIIPGSGEAWRVRP